MAKHYFALVIHISGKFKKHAYKLRDNTHVFVFLTDYLATAEWLV